MAYGTAGFTAVLCVLKLQAHGLTNDSGEVLVTGATGKTKERDFLTDLGAEEVITRAEADDSSGRPILKGRWGGVVDTVGGNILATAIKSTKEEGCVACCGNAMSADLAMSVFPFTLSGVSLLVVHPDDTPAWA